MTSAATCVNGHPAVSDVICGIQAVSIAAGGGNRPRTTLATTALNKNHCTHNHSIIQLRYHRFQRVTDVAKIAAMMA